MKPFLLSLSVLLSISLFAQRNVSNVSTLSVEQIMQGEKFVGYLPSNIHWSEDGAMIYFSWNPEMDTLRSTFQISKNGGEAKALSTEERIAKPSQRGSYNRAKTHKVYSKNGDLFLLDIAKKVSEGV